MAKDAKGHGSNSRGYRGKYPDRIHTVSGMHERGLAHVRTNKGDKFYIRAKNTGGVMPKPGDGMDKYPHAEPIPANNEQAASQLASGPKSAPAPVHEAMQHSGHYGTMDMSRFTADMIAAHAAGVKYQSKEETDPVSGRLLKRSRK